MLKSLLNKVSGFHASNFIKDTPTRVFSCEYWEIFINTYFKKHLQTAASVNCKNFYRAAESQIEIKYKKLKFILYFEQILQRALVFLLLTLNSWEAKRGIKCRIYLNASKSLYWKQSK